MRKIIALLLVVTFVLCALAACASDDGDATTGTKATASKPTSTTGQNSSGEDNGENNGNENNGGNQNGGNTDAAFTPVLRFVVASDMHVSTANGEQAKKTAAMIKQMNAYAASGADGYSRLDAILIAGDLTDNGTAEQFKVINNVFKENIKYGTELILSMGNHDYKGGAGFTAFKDEFGENSTMRHEVIGGYHFISIYGDGNNTASDYTQAMCDELESRIKAAIADTGADKPVFIVQHVGELNTVGGTDSHTHSKAWAATEALSAMKSKYSNLVVFSGHTHFPNNDEASIWQGAYTAINTGTLFYTTKAYNNDEPILLKNNYEIAQCYVVEVDKNSHVRIRCYDVSQERFVGETWLIDSYDPDDFKYTADRFDADDIFFEDGAAISVDKEYSDAVLISFPPVSENSIAGRVYEIKVFDSQKKLVSTQYVGDEYFKDIFDRRIPVSIGGLTVGQEYTVEVVAINSLYTSNIASEGALRTKALSLTFTRGALTSSGADIIDLEIDSTSKSATSDVLHSLDAKVAGTLTFDYDESIKSDVLAFDGKGSGVIKFGNYAFVGDTLVDSFTLETYIRVDEKKDGVIFGGTQAGGFSLKVSGKKLVFTLDTDPGMSYTAVNKDISFNYVLGQYYHIVVVFDGSKTVLYANGEEMGRITMSGFGIPVDVFSRSLWIGVDVGYGGHQEYQNYAAFTMADFKLYSYSFTAAQLNDAFDAAPDAPIVEPPPTPNAVVIDMNVNSTSNTVTNGVAGIATHSNGTLTTAYDSTIAKDVLVLNGTGDGLVRFGDYKSILSDLEDSISVEAYFKLNEMPANGASVVVIGGTQSGGFGLSAYGAGNGDNSNKMLMSYHNGTAYVSLSFAYEVNTYYHMVAVFDGANYNLYVNGELVATTAMTRFATCFEQNHCHEYVWLGVDTGRDGEHEATKYAKCSIAEFKVYNYGLKAAEVTAAYNAAK